MKCQFYRGALDRSSEHQVSVMAILKGIKNGAWEKQIEGVRDGSIDKKDLPAATFAGTFSSSLEPGGMVTRLDSNIEKYTGIIIIDIDKKDLGDEAEEIIEIIREQLLDDPYVFSYFYSPSGGLKVLYVVDSQEDIHRDVAYPQVIEYFENNYEIPLDTTSKNLSRLCFVGYDPNIYINKDFFIFEVDPNWVSINELSRKPITKHSKFFEKSDDINYIAEKAREWTQRYFSGGDGSKNNYCHLLACILNRAGVPESEALDIVMQDSCDHKPHLKELTVRGAYRRNAGEFGTRPILIKKKSVTLFDE